MDKNILNKLYEELPVSIKPGGQGFKYIKTKDVIDRLNKTFEGDWSTEVIKTDKVGDEYLVEIKVSRLDGSGRVLSSHTGFGSAKIFANAELGNLFKSAKSRAIKDAAKSFGVGLMLNTSKGGNNYTQPVGDKPANPEKFPSHIPTNSNMQSGNGFTSTTPPAGFMGAETAPILNKTQESVPSMSSTPFSGPKEQVMPEKASNFPPMQAVPEVSKPAEAPQQSSGLPPTGNSPIQNTTSPQMPVMEADMANAQITQIQKIVINQRAEAKGLTFKEYVTEQFALINHKVDYDFETIEDLLYKDAILIVAN